LRQDKAPPPLDFEYLGAAASDRSKSHEEVRAHFAGVFMATAGTLMHLLTGLRSQLEKKIPEIEAKLKILNHWRSGRVGDIAIDTGEPVQWGRAALIRTVTFGVACFGLLLMGWISLMGTLAESGYEVFESFVMRASFSLLPALGITAGWKQLGSLQDNLTAENTYWKRVNILGLVLGGVWVLALGLTFGDSAWGSGTPDDLPMPDESSSGMGSGVIMVITGILAETLLAAGCWRQVDEELNRHRSLKVIEDLVTCKADDWIETHESRLTKAIELKSALAGRIDAIERGRDSYAEQAVTALTPRWRPPMGPDGPQTAPISPRRPGGPDVLRNGQNHREETRA
jgi:hypothetical protein